MQRTPLGQYNLPSTHLEQVAFPSGADLPHDDHSGPFSTSLAHPVNMDGLFHSHTDFGFNDKYAQPQAQTKKDNTLIVPEDLSHIPPPSQFSQYRQQEVQGLFLSPLGIGEAPVSSELQPIAQYVENPFQTIMYCCPPAQNCQYPPQRDPHPMFLQSDQTQQQGSLYCSIEPDDGPQHQQGSHVSSVNSSGAFLTDSSVISPVPRPAGSKIKLTLEDKLNIVDLHRSNPSLRQEDIARQYGVDRSTISKIISALHPWQQRMKQQVHSAQKQHRTVDARFPAVETMMHKWMDSEIAAGRDVRDSLARAKAKDYARSIGFPVGRFKASSNWLDNFKERRRAGGRPVLNPPFQITQCPTQYRPDHHLPSRCGMTVSSISRFSPPLMASTARFPLRPHQLDSGHTMDRQPNT